MPDPKEASRDRAGDDDIEDELLRSCRELCVGFTALDHLRWSPTIAHFQPGPSRERRDRRTWRRTLAPSTSGDGGGGRLPS